MTPISISFAPKNENLHFPLVVGCFDDLNLSQGAEDLNAKTGGGTLKALKSKNFSGKRGEIVSLLVSSDLSYPEVYVAGLGDPATLSPKDIEELGGKIFAAVSKTQNEKVIVDIKATFENAPVHFEALLASGALLRSWSFNKYKTKKKDESKLKEIIFTSVDAAKSETEFKNLKAVAEGVFLTRHVVSEPPNVIYPESMADMAKKELAPLGVTVEVLGENEMAKLGMGALLGVGQGSEKESQLIVLQWMNGEKGKAPLAVIGKGVTFDTGGISIKPSNNMEDMKYDMAGSGVVLGLMKALALRGAKANVVGIMGMVENMPSGSAIKPADVLTSMSGQTIEVVNTDAEGRLVLADALWYSQNRFKPSHMIDLATLTWAITVALGEEYAGLFSTDDDLANHIFKAGEETGEWNWRMPLCDGYDKDIDSVIADVKNVGSGRGAGSATAAHFLKRFVNDVPWAHLDIAGMAWNKKGSAIADKGATGYGVRLLDQFIRSFIEK
jgi:leucyl aminopeptidase